MYKDTVTLFNRIVSVETVTWHASVLQNVDLNADKSAILAQYGDSCQDAAKLHVSYTGDGLVGTLRHYESKAYQALTDKTGALTFQSGSDFDFFVVGDVAPQTDVSDDDYTDGFYNYCNRVYDGCYAITSVAKYSVIPHFEIMAR